MSDKSENLVLDGVTIAASVVDTLVRLATQEVAGVEIAASPTRRLTASARSVEIEADGAGSFSVAVHVKLASGLKLRDTAAAIQRAVSDALSVQLGVAPSSVDVFIDALEFGQA